MWSIFKQAKPVSRNLPDWCFIEYPKQLCETLHRLYVRAYDSQILSGMNPNAFVDNIGKLGRLEILPSQNIISSIEKSAYIYASLFGNRGIDIHPNILNFLNSPEHIDTYVLNTLFRKLSGTRNNSGTHLFRSGIAQNLLADNIAMCVSGLNTNVIDTIPNETFNGPYSSIKKELSVWSMAVLPLVYEYFDAMKIADEYIRVRALESEVPALCVHPMCLKTFKIDKRIVDLFKFYVVDGNKMIATFCCDAHATAAKDNGINYLTEHVNFVSGLNKNTNIKFGRINKNMFSVGWDKWKERDCIVTYIEYPLCRQPFVAELNNIIASVCDDNKCSPYYPRLYTPLEIYNTISQCTVAELSSWREFFMAHGLSVDVVASKNEREILQRMRETWAQDKDFGFFSMDEKFKKNY